MSTFVVAGGSGFLGRPLVAALIAGRHDVVVLTRTPREPQNGIRFAPWTPDGTAGALAAEIEGADAVINLAGESIAGARWSPNQKRRILDSRVNATRSLAAAISQVPHPPPVLISGSAVGYYGPRGGELVTEETPAGSDFLAGVCVRWEEEAERAASARTRVVRVRTGLVLDAGGGALPRMLPPFRLFAGGPVGSGRQYWPWIHLDDWIGLVQWAIGMPAVAGALNATAPNPVTNAEFAGALGRALHRPALLPAPAFALKLLLGEMAGPLLLSGARVIPAKALHLGFTFRYETIDAALAAVFEARRTLR